MRLWTIHAADVWQKLQRDGVLQGKAELADPDFAPAYRWMIDQMGWRIGPPPPGVDSPLWAWYQYDSASKPRPDLRRHGHLPHGTQGVMIEFNCTPGSVLLSDFLAWHHVLNDWYLATSEADSSAFEARSMAMPADECRRQKTKSWELIFDIKRADPEGYATAPRPEDRPIQATLWELRLDQVVKVAPFVAR